MTAVQEELFALRDAGYRDFVARLIPTLDRERIIGVRAPALGGFARAFAKRPEAAAFLAGLPHFYLEENGLHAALINGIRDYDACVAALDAFLPHVDNWATCDSLRPACFKRNRTRLLGEVRRWMDSGALYTRRFAIEMLMTHFLDADFRPEMLDWVAAIRTEEYYLRMMQAWYFATALAMQYEAALPLLEEGRLEPWTHGRTIQKAVESFRIPGERKAYLKTLRKRG